LSTDRRAQATARRLDGRSTSGRTVTEEATCAGTRNKRTRKSPTATDSSAKAASNRQQRTPSKPNSAERRSTKRLKEYLADEGWLKKKQLEPKDERRTDERPTAADPKPPHAADSGGTRRHGTRRALAGIPGETPTQRLTAIPSPTSDEASEEEAEETATSDDAMSDDAPGARRKQPLTIRPWAGFGGQGFVPDYTARRDEYTRYKDAAIAEWRATIGKPRWNGDPPVEVCRKHGFTPDRRFERWRKSNDNTYEEARR